MKKWTSVIKKEASMRGTGTVTVTVFASCFHKLNRYGRVIDARDVDLVIREFEEYDFGTLEEAAEWVTEEVRKIRNIRIKTRISAESASSECEMM